MQTEKNVLSVKKEVVSPNILSNGQRTYTIPYILNGILFKIISQNDFNIKVNCLKCPGNNILSGNLRRTGNFHKHIRAHHPELLLTVAKMKADAELNRQRSLIKKWSASTVVNKPNTKVINKNSKKDSVPPLRQPNIETAYQPYQKEPLHTTISGSVNRRILKRKGGNPSVLLNVNVKSVEQINKEVFVPQPKKNLMNVVTSFAPQQVSTQTSKLHVGTKVTNKVNSVQPIVSSSKAVNKPYYIYSQDTARTNGIYTLPSEYETRSHITSKIDKIESDIANLNKNVQLLLVEVRRLSRLCTNNLLS